MQTKKTLFGIGIPGLGISIAYASFSTISAHFTGDTAPIKHARFQIPALTDTEKAALQEQHKEQLAQQLAQQLAEGNSTPQQYDEMLTHLETGAFPMMKGGRRNHRNFGSGGMWSGELPRFPTTGASFSGGKLHFERI